MRKTIFTALVTLLVMLAVVSCDVVPEMNNPLYANTGDGMVTLSINTGGSTGSGRSIDDTQAKKDGTLVEVIFKHTVGTGTGATTTYYRAEGYKGTTLRITIPTGTYTTGNDNDAIVLIGKPDDGTLLATGALKDGTATITSTTTSVTFTAKSLIFDINANATTPSFVIDETNATIVSKGFNGGNTKGGTVGTGKYCFQVPTGATTAIKATLNFTNATPATTSPPVAATSDTFDGQNIVVVDGSTLTPVVTPVTINRIQGDGTITLASTVATGFLTAKSVDFTFTTSSATSLHFITYKIPVVGFTKFTTSAATPGLENAITWFIRGGTESGLDLTGDKHDSVVLSVKNSPTDVDLVINVPGYQ